LDKKVSAEVDSAKNTKVSTVNVNKNLMAGTGVLDSILKYASGARTWHLAQTLPWSDNGLRLLPMSNFLTYKENLATLEKNYTALVDKFVIAYPNLVSAAAFQLGDLFDREEYPDVEKVARKFKFGVNYMPVPMAGDFRIDINEEAKSEIVASCEKAYADRLNNAMKDAWDRLHKVLLRMSDRLGVDVVDSDVPESHGQVMKPRVFKDTMLEEATELVDLLAHFNVARDPMMEEARKDLAVAIMNHDSTDLRQNMIAREAVKNKVDAILSKFSF
jgi:hypothetical protein